MRNSTTAIGFQDFADLSAFVEYIIKSLVSVFNSPMTPSEVHVIFYHEKKRFGATVEARDSELLISRFDVPSYDLPEGVQPILWLDTVRSHLCSFLYVSYYDLDEFGGNGENKVWTTIKQLDH